MNEHKRSSASLFPSTVCTSAAAETGVDNLWSWTRLQSVRGWKSEPHSAAGRCGPSWTLPINVWKSYVSPFNVRFAVVSEWKTLFEVLSFLLSLRTACVPRGFRLGLLSIFPFVQSVQAQRLYECVTRTTHRRRPLTPSLVPISFSCGCSWLALVYVVPAQEGKRRNTTF